MAKTRSLIQCARLLYDLGFAVHWLKPKSKAPIKSGWASGKRDPWDVLEKEHVPNYNLGVRLGRASTFKDGTCLSVIDCDVKSINPADRAEMEEKLKELVGDLKTLTVWTGRGNGSRHIYVRGKDPLPSRRYSQSPHKVQLLMPSTPPSKRELETIPKKQLEKGIRSRAAWEISLMGNGMQTVLPPSLHPDTGLEYRAKGKLESYTDIALFTLDETALEASKSPPTRAREAKDITFVEVDLVSSDLPDSVVDAIISGKGVTDRSATLFEVALQMFRKGYSRDQVVSVLTDPENFLASCAYDHTHSSDRTVAAQWLEKYTIGKAERETSARAQFEDDVEIASALPEDQAEQQAADLIDEGDWREGIERGSNEQGARPKATLKNLVLILRGEASPKVIRHNEFSGSDFYSENAPWGGRKDKELADQDLIDIKYWLSETHRFEPATGLIMEAVKKIGAMNRFHPVRDYLKGLEWDGTPRLDNWLFTYLNARGPKKYVRAIGAKTLIAMVKRVMEPGCKFDQVLILEGAQGVGKSTAVRILSEPWFSDGDIDIQDKDGVMAMRSIWVVELGELSGMRKADTDKQKEFISRQSDRIRAPYGRLSENFPRQCIFIGTTNSDHYLKDLTGNRRFWPVKVGALERDALKRDRDQLLAEALTAYQWGEPVYLDQDDAQKEAEREQEKRVFQDSWLGTIERFLAARVDGIGGRSDFNYDEFTTAELLEFPLKSRDTRQDQMRVSDCMKQLGYVKFRKRREGLLGYFWRKSRIPV